MVHIVRVYSSTLWLRLVARFTRDCFALTAIACVRNVFSRLGRRFHCCFLIRSCTRGLVEIRDDVGNNIPGSGATRRILASAKRFVVTIHATADASCSTVCTTGPKLFGRPNTTSQTTSRWRWDNPFQDTAGCLLAFALTSF